MSFSDSVTPNYPRRSLKLESAEKSKNLLACVMIGKLAINCLKAVVSNL